MAMRAYGKISAEERAWAYHLSVDRAEADYRNGLRLAREEGELHGFERGKLEDARNLLAMGLLTREQVAQATGLPLERVRQLTGES